jgi:RNA polymerase sigma-70 factor (ECF subfamily)
VDEQVSETPKAQLNAEFSELYRAHLRDVYSYAYYRVGDHHDAEDLTEQTFLQAYRHFERAQRESHGRPLRPWLIRIAHNLAANLYRDRSRKPSWPIDETTSLTAPHTTEQLVEGREELGRVLDGVHRLPDDRREALIMRFALGMDNREIARALGRTDGATKVLIHRAIKQLEELVRETGGQEEPGQAEPRQEEQEQEEPGQPEARQEEQGAAEPREEEQGEAAPRQEEQRRQELGHTVHPEAPQR